MIVFEERQSDSPYIESVTHGYTPCAGSTIRPSEMNWHMVFVKHGGKTNTLVVGALETSGVVHYGEGAEILWVKFKLGTFMPHLPTKHFFNKELSLPEGCGKSFWLKSSTWALPTYENVETFVQRLHHEMILITDPLVDIALNHPPQALLTASPRTVRHRFLQTIGLTQTYILQMKRAFYAADLLRQGKSILDTVVEAGYFDQPHLTRSLKKFIGYTPLQWLRMNEAAMNGSSSEQATG